MPKSFKPLALCLLAASACCASLPFCHAAPMTFKFQATVGPLPPGNRDIGLPFTLMEGSVIDGLLTIDSALNATPPGLSTSYSESVQPFLIKFSYQGYSFGTEQYRARVFNDNAIIEFGGNVIPADLIRLDCSSSSVACAPEPLDIPGAPPLRFSMNMSFAGPVLLLPSATSAVDLDTWNGFTIERSLNFVLIEGPNKAAGFFTTVSAFTVIPEPSTVWLSAGFVTLMAAKRSSRIRY